MGPGGPGLAWEKGDIFYPRGEQTLSDSKKKGAQQGGWVTPRFKLDIMVTLYN